MTMEASWSGKIAKSLVIFGSGIALSACAYAAFRYWKRRESKSVDEGFEDVSRLEENPEKRIIVLGLEGAGKSTILSQVTSGSCKNHDVQPIDVKPTEVGGGEKVRKYWGNFLQDTDLLVFVVDASDPHNLSLAVKEFKSLLGEDRLNRVPILILANKQDRPEALTPEQVADALDIGSISSSKHKVRVLGTQAPSQSQARHPSIVEVKQSLLVMSADN
ncbi:hypothetical protein C0J52_13147 [Blattella germanica]|nr:hypothetical protein C0J52_13147 [Blattella germanica]